MREKKKTIIYGLGQKSKLIQTSFFKINNHEYDIFAVSDKKEPSENHGWIYINPQDINHYDYDSIIITSDKYYEEIKNELVNDYFVDEKKVLQLSGIYDQYIHRLFHTRLFSDKTGIEIGGPSGIFEDTIYPVVKGIDGINYSRDTMWWKNDGDGTYISQSGKVLGHVIIADAVDLSIIDDSKYDFAISSNNLEHIANPMKAVSELTRVVKKNGYIFIVVPKKEDTFDHNREYTSFEHILEDYRKNVGEDDLTHIGEILKNHDYNLDKACDGKERFYERSLRNYENRGLHHHVFCENSLKKIFEYFSIQIVDIGILPGNYFVLGKI